MIWLVFIGCVVAASMLSGIESALLTVSRVRARHAASEGDRSALRLAALLENRNNLVQAAIAMNHVLALVAFISLAVALQHWMGEWGIGLAVIIAVPVFLMGLELMPKSLFRNYPFRLLKRMLPLLSILNVLAMPWRVAGRWLQPHAAPDATPPPLGAGLTELTESICQLNLLPADAAALMQRFAGFNRETAATLMLPLKNLSALPADLPLRTAAQMAREIHARYQAVMDDHGVLMGCLDAAVLPSEFGQDKLVRQFAQPMAKLRTVDTALVCLQTLRRASSPLALVNDENGQPVGLLSVEQLTGWMNGITSTPPRTPPSAPHPA